ncbi:hypothetical protein [Cellulomonas xiejunii]|uniref:hypothetical protein n=1 Tax=Cellulomonas xiejunii TaxID=2968083 RepID=UPI001D0E5062|nr:hypothetical protein [Cellulomonas xiejunii]MCC2320249.1 hypothetical protein [Cellulomonas xiejunii]
MLRTTRPCQHDTTAPALHPGHETAHTTRRECLRAARRRRAHRRGRLALAVVAAAAAALPTAATARDVGPGVSTARGARMADRASVPATDRDAAGRSAAIEDAEAWCDHVSSYYLAFPSPWSARVVNCRSTDLSVAPVRADGSLGSCVLVPAQHSRHLGGDIIRWVTDIQLC